MPPDPQPDLDPAVARLIRDKARALARAGAIPRADVEDAEQDLALAVVAARAGYDPARGTPAGYAAGVIRHAAGKLARGRFAAKRHPGRVGRLAALDAEPADPAADRAVRAADAAADVPGVVAGLRPDLRAAAAALAGGSVAGAARGLGVTRGTVYARVRELRAYFERAGLGGP